MKTNTLVYRPPSKWSIINAFLAAVMLHLGAVALASHRENISPPRAFEPGDVIGFELDETAPPVPPEVEIPVPPPPSFNAEFIEEQPHPVARKIAAGPILRPETSRIAGASNPRALAISAPRPDYPYEARSRHVTGSGVVSMRVDPASGAVLEANMEQSIGNPILDQVTLSTFRRWRFAAGTPRQLRVPITFTLTGAQY